MDLSLHLHILGLIACAVKLFITSLPLPRASALTSELNLREGAFLGIFLSRVKDTKGADRVSGLEQVCGKLNSQWLVFPLLARIKNIAPSARSRKTEERIDNINDISVSVYVSNDLINRLALAP
jgi:hypothetical protein